MLHLIPCCHGTKEAARVCVMFLSLLCLLHSKNTTLLHRHKARCVYMAFSDVGKWGAAHGEEQPRDAEGFQLRHTRRGFNKNMQKCGNAQTSE